MKNAAADQVPTLLRHAQAKPNLVPSPREKPEEGEYLPPRILSHNPDAEQVITAALLYSQGVDLARAEETAQAMSPEERETILSTFALRTDSRQTLPREFEMASCRIGLTLDYGALRELNRHRIQTNLNQPLHPRMGYNLPPLAEEAGTSQIFAAAAERSQQLYETLHRKAGPHVAQYAVLHCHWQRTQIGANLRQLHNLLRLRTRGERPPLPS